MTDFATILQRMGLANTLHLEPGQAAQCPECLTGRIVKPPSGSMPERCPECTAKRRNAPPPELPAIPRAGRQAGQLIPCPVCQRDKAIRIPVKGAIARCCPDCRNMRKHAGRPGRLAGTAFRCLECGVGWITVPRAGAAPRRCAACQKARKLKIQRQRRIQARQTTDSRRE
ncbi:MAG: hypothetical protein OXE84_02985 [Rhodobacteraceae bacterium]|nr:hypothetical protein [Paracoccaceae bacterium]MCY4326905.1 hypothetical protein [Paracoccaceae bacterium]